MNFDSNEFNHFLRGSLKHGWLQKRSKGLKSVIPRTRYFVLCEESLYWFAKEKSKFIQKGELDMTDARLVGVKEDTMTVHKNSTGKDYFISGEKISEWADILKAILEPLGRDFNDRLTLSCKQEEGQVMLAELGGGITDSAFSEGDAVPSRKSTGHSTQASSTQASSKNSNSFVGGHSCSEVPLIRGDSDADDSLSSNECLGMPILTKEVLESHDSSFEPFTLEYVRNSEKVVDRDEINVRDAIFFFENLDEPKQTKRRRRRKKRLFSHFGPETKDRLEVASIGGEECPEPEDHVIHCFSDLADSLATMLDELDGATGNLESQTLDNLFLWERGNSLLPKSQREQQKKVLVTTESEPSVLRVPTGRSDFSRSSNGSTYRYSRGSSYGVFRGSAYKVPGFSRFVAPQMSLVSVDSEESLTAMSFPESEEEFDGESPYEEIEHYIQARLAKNESVSMIDLTNEFRDKRVPENGFRKIFSIVRDRVETDKIISYRQSTTIKSELRMIYEYFCDAESQEIGERGRREILQSEFVQRKLTSMELTQVQQTMLPRMDFDDFTHFLTDLPMRLGFKLRCGLDKHLQKYSPYKRVCLTSTELKKFIKFDEDGLLVKFSGLTSVEKGWALIRLNGNLIFTEEEKDDFLSTIKRQTPFQAQFAT